MLDNRISAPAAAASDSAKRPAESEALKTTTATAFVAFAFRAFLLAGRMAGRKAAAAGPTSLLLLLFLVLPSSALTKNPDIFTYLTIGDTDSLDPAWAYDAASQSVIINMYEYLLDFKGSGVQEKDLIARLAEKVPSLANGLISQDGLTYRFPIRKNVKFQDGSLLTPEDVRYSLLRFMLQDRDGGPSVLLLEPILGLDSTREGGKLRADVFEQASKAVSVEDNVVVIHLKKPFAPFLGILARYGAIVSKSWCATHGQWDGRAETLAEFNNPKRESSYLMEHANGTGPYGLERIDKNTRSIFLARHEGYFRGPAKIKKVVIKVMDEIATRKLMLQAGDADSIYAQEMYFPQLNNLEGVQVLDGFQNIERMAILFFSFKINMTANANVGSGKFDGNGIPGDFFADIDVRKAFAYAIDYDAYVRDIQRGKGRQAASFIPQGLVGYKADLKKHTLDLKKSEEYFKKAFGGKAWSTGFKFILVHNAGSAQAQTLCQMIKKNVESLNPKFRIDIRSLQWSSYLEQSQAGKMPMYMGAWGADYPDAHNFAYPLLHSNGYFPGKQGYKNPEVDRIIEEAVGVLDPKKRAKLYLKLQTILFDEAPHIHIAESTRFRAQRSWIKGYVFNPTFPDAPYSSYYYDLTKEIK